MLLGEHSAILSTFIKLQFVIKSFVLSIFEWPRFYCIYKRPKPSNLVPVFLCFMSHVLSSACKVFIKNIETDLAIAKFKYLTFDPAQRVRCWGKIFDTVVLIYSHRAIIAHSEKLMDIKALGITQSQSCLF